MPAPQAVPTNHRGDRNMAARMRENDGRVAPGWRLAIWGGAAVLLSLPALAMWLGADGVYWTALDFAVMAALLATVCGGWELAMRMSRGSAAYRLGACLALGCGFLLAWINLAVGIVGEPEHPANLAFFGVVAVAIAGAALARCRASGLARAMNAAAAAQLLAGAIALASRSTEGVALALVFAALWACAGQLFRRAGRAR